MSAPRSARPAPRTRWLRALLVLLSASAALPWVWALWLVPRAIELETRILSRQRGWLGKPHQADERLGVAPRPGARGAHLLPVGPPVPMGFDERGLRVPVGEAGARRSRRQEALKGRPLVLFLGDSMTYGDSTPAEETFAEVVGEWLQVPVANGGVCGYGLSQMVLRGRQLIPELRPAVVVVQHSSWLADRGRSPYAPTYWGKVPVPYAVSAEPLRFAPPLYPTAVTELDLEPWIRPGPSGAPSRGQFLRRVALPLLAHEDRQEALLWMRTRLGQVEAPLEDSLALERAAYREFQALCREHGARLLVLPLGVAMEALLDPAVYLPEGVRAVPAQRHLIQSLPKLDRETYSRTYHHWRGDPPQLVDEHPNPAAHRLIAEELVVWLRKAGLGGP